MLYAPLSVRQREAYDRVLDGDLRSWLIGGGTAAEKEEAGPSTIIEDSEEEDENKTKRSLRRRRGKKFYDVDGDDDEYFDKLERGEVDERGYKRKLSREEEQAEQLRVVLEHQARQKGNGVASSRSTRDAAPNPPSSQTGQQHEAPKHGDAASKSMLAPFSLRLADRQEDPRARPRRGAGECEWKDDGPRSSAPGVVP